MPKNKRKQELDAIAVMRDEYEPRMVIPEKMLKEIKDWKVGEEYEVQMKVVMEMKEEMEEKGMKAGFRIKEISN